MSSKSAVIDATLAALASPDPSADGERADLRLDDRGAQWVRPHLAPGAEAIASTQYTATANSAAITVPDGSSKINIFVDVTAIGADANETLDIVVEWSSDTGTTWFGVETAQSFTQIAQTGGADQNVVKQFDVMAPTYRLVITLAGTTPDFTFAVDHVGVYA